MACLVHSYKTMLEETAQRTAIHYATLIYATEQLGFENVFTECFTYVGDILFLWNIYDNRS